MEQILTPPEPNQSTPLPSPRFLSFTLSFPLALGPSDLSLAPFSDILFHPFLPTPAFVLLSVSVHFFLWLPENPPALFSRTRMSLPAHENVYLRF